MSILNPAAWWTVFYCCLKVSKVGGWSGIQTFQINAIQNFSPEIMTSHTKKALGFSIWLFNIKFRKWKFNILYFLWVWFDQKGRIEPVKKQGVPLTLVSDLLALWFSKYGLASLALAKSRNLLNAEYKFPTPRIYILISCLGLEKFKNIV